jgi:hypothetical protein
MSDRCCCATTDKYILLVCVACAKRRNRRLRDMYGLRAGWNRLGNVKGRAPQLPCVYAIYEAGRLVYVGQTINLRIRMRQYRVANENVKFRVVFNKNNRLRLEAMFIARLRPCRNQILFRRPRPAIALAENATSCVRLA